MAAMNSGVFPKNGGAIPKKKREKRVDSNQFAALATNEHLEIDVDHHDENMIDSVIHIPPIGKSDHDVLIYDLNIDITHDNETTYFNYFKGNYA